MIPQHKDNLQLLVLAAGQSQRFGGQKLLAPLAGRAVISHVLAAARQAIAGGLAQGGVIVSSGDTAVFEDEAHTITGLEVVRNSQPECGLSESIRLGLLALEQNLAGDRRPAAALVLLADQPLIRLEVMATLVAAWRLDRRPIVRPRYADDPGRPGNPTLIDRTLWHRAATLTGDEGFGAVIRRDELSVFEVPAPGANPDIDTVADLAAIEAILKGTAHA